MHTFKGKVLVVSKASRRWPFLCIEHAKSRKIAVQTMMMSQKGKLQCPCPVPYSLSIAIFKAMDNGELCENTCCTACSRFGMV